MSRVEQRWTERWFDLLRGGVPGQQEVDADHPVRLLFGTDGLGRALFLSLTHARPALPSISGVVEASRGRRAADGQWTLALTLLDARFEGVFIDLCSELVRSTANADSEAAALSAVTAEIEGWTDLFVAPPAGELSREALRGLVAEAWYGFELSNSSRPAEDVVRAWGGPLGGVRDFSFSDLEVEVKSVHEGVRTVRISSAEQLDPGATSMQLVVITLLDAGDETPASVSLESLVTAASSQLEATGRLELSRRLRAQKVDLDAGYARERFVPSRVRVYEVSSSFPSVRRSRLDAAMTTVQYELGLTDLDDHLTEDIVNPGASNHE